MATETFADGVRLLTTRKISDYKPPVIVAIYQCMVARRVTSAYCMDLVKWLGEDHPVFAADTHVGSKRRRVSRSFDVPVQVGEYVLSKKLDVLRSGGSTKSVKIVIEPGPLERVERNQSRSLAADHPSFVRDHRSYSDMPHFNEPRDPYDRAPMRHVPDDNPYRQPASPPVDLGPLIERMAAMERRLVAAEQELSALKARPAGGVPPAFREEFDEAVGGMISTSGRLAGVEIFLEERHNYQSPKL